MILRAAARPGAILVCLAALAGCETKGPLAGAETPGALTVDQGQTWYGLGVRLLATREPAQAERAFNRSLAVEGMNARTLTGLGMATAQQGLLTRARAHLEAARDLAPEDIAVHNNLGVVLYDLGEYHAARQAFQTAFLISSGSSEVVAQNLAKAEQAILRTTEPEQPDPAISHRLQRMGDSEYRLLEIDAGGVGTATGTGTPG